MNKHATDVEAYLADEDPVPDTPEWRSLEDLRPRSLKEFIGNEGVKTLLGGQMRNGFLPRRIFLYGPSGAGKTTLAHILSRYAFCKIRKGFGNPCGECPMCKTDLYSISNFHEWTGADVDEQWKWWLGARTESFLDNPRTVLFIDETQGLRKQRQQELHRFVETFKGRIIFATTHRHDMDDALTNRFAPYVLELTRPLLEEAVKHLETAVCKPRGITVSQPQLMAVARHYDSDMRKCVNFVCAAGSQNPEKTVTDSFITAMLGAAAISGSSHVESVRGGRRPRL